ncbi:endoplasmic reticulum-golgi intermediate compartment protein 3 [Phtheirospermum japonicum]|uniref:Endoplasmic reticulum-golgi intermediate compartment protein 3 n=1 Tax=Phtheirospermum japonicum TaxID=374723 RepID=A0A830CTB2_9LAMI|nr:endoplasmic reticulum-golgi intermediate compartment protein 3 [Phtheirospermum japonicum]
MDRTYNKLRNLDAYPKINENFYSCTLSGGVITLTSFIIIALLFISEFRLYLHMVTESKLVVDTTRGGKLRINFDVTFSAIPCTLLSLDTMDISGERHLDIRHGIFKKKIDSHANVIEVRQEGIGVPKIERPLQRHGGRLEHNETYCGSCFGAESSDEECCNSCEFVKHIERKDGD